MQNTAMFRISAIVLTAIFVFGCDSQNKQDTFIEDASRVPSGYAATDATGAIISDDKDDWRTAPIFAGKVRFDPAFPNPTIGQFVSLPVFIMEFNSIQGGLVLRADDGQGSLRLLDEILDASQPGGYTLRFSPAVLGRTGLIRLFVTDRLGELVSYGDLSVG